MRRSPINTRIVYNGAAFCGVSQSSIFNTVVPAPSYFKAVGLKKSYQAWADKLTCPVDASGVQDKSCNVAFVRKPLHICRRSLESPRGGDHRHWRGQPDASHQSLHRPRLRIWSGFAVGSN